MVTKKKVKTRQTNSGTRPQTTQKKDIFLIRCGNHYRIVMISKKIFDENPRPFRSTRTGCRLAAGLRQHLRLSADQRDAASARSTLRLLGKWRCCGRNLVKLPCTLRDHKS